MTKKLTGLTKMALDENWGGIALGNHLRFFAKQEQIFNKETYSYLWKDTGDLGVDGSLQTFCYPDLAKVFGLKVRELKQLFRPNIMKKVRITIEILDEEEWEYTK